MVRRPGTTGRSSLEKGGGDFRDFRHVMSDPTLREQPGVKHPTYSRAGSQIELGARAALAIHGKINDTGLRVPASFRGHLLKYMATQSYFGREKRCKMKGSLGSCPRGPLSTSQILGTHYCFPVLVQSTTNIQYLPRYLCRYVYMSSS